MLDQLGQARLLQALASGQYCRPEGLFFGGASRQSSFAIVAELLHPVLESVEVAAAIDVHTGIGPAGVDTLLVEYSRSDERHGQLAAALGPRVTTPSMDDSASYHVSGVFLSWLERQFPHCRWLAVLQEFGTIPVLDVIAALVQENVAYHNRGNGDVDAPARTAICEAFCPSDPNWRTTILDRGLLLVYRSLHRLLV